MILNQVDERMRGKETACAAMQSYCDATHGSRTEAGVTTIVQDMEFDELTTCEPITINLMHRGQGVRSTEIQYESYGTKASDARSARVLEQLHWSRLIPFILHERLIQIGIWKCCTSIDVDSESAWEMLV